MPNAHQFVHASMPDGSEGGITPAVVGSCFDNAKGENNDFPQQSAGSGTAEPAADASTRAAGHRLPEARIAVIDIGSNSIRLVIADCKFSVVERPQTARPAGGSSVSLEQSSHLSESRMPEPSPHRSEEAGAKTKKPATERPVRRVRRVEYSVVAEQRAATQLATGLDSTGKLDAKAMEQSAAAIRDMVNIATDLGVPVGKIRAMATCAVREASNRKEFLALVRRWSGLKVKTISAKREAKFAFSSAKASFELSKLHSGGAAIIDVGGGSTEVILTGCKHKAARMKRIFLLPVGAVRVTERFGGPDVAAMDRYEELLGFARKTAKQTIWELDRRPGVLIGIGGTITALARLLLAAGRGAANAPGEPNGHARLPGGLEDAVQGMRITQDDVQSALLALRALDSSTRRDVPGMARDRADTIVGGLVIVLAVMERLGNPTLIVHVGGIRDGILRRSARKELAAAAMAEDKPATKR